MSDLIERLRKEQGRLQRVYDSGHESVKRRRAIKYRLKMMREAADEIERLQAKVEALEKIINNLFCVSDRCGITVECQICAAQKSICKHQYPDDETCQCSLCGDMDRDYRAGRE